jgi:hypothetical protein
MEDPRVAGSPRRLIVVAWAWPGPPGRLDTETQVPARQDGSEGGRRGTGTRQKRMGGVCYWTPTAGKSSYPVGSFRA